MSYFRGDFLSQALGMHTGMQVIIPDIPGKANADWPVLYLLHGMSDNCTSWVCGTSVARYAELHGVAVVMPEVQLSFYADMAYGPAYFSYITQELPAYVHRIFGLSTKREKSFVAGLSMGGYGALKCALTYPKRYAGCGAFSSACDMEGMLREAEGNPRLQRDLQGILGTAMKISPKDDLGVLAVKCAKSQTKPWIYMTCGLEDRLLPANRAMRAHLEKLGFEPHYEEWEGTHSWEFWDESICHMFDYYFVQK